MRRDPMPFAGILCGPASFGMMVRLGAVVALNSFRSRIRPKHQEAGGVYG